MGGLFYVQDGTEQNRTSGRPMDRLWMGVCYQGSEVKADNRTILTPYVSLDTLRQATVLAGLSDERFSKKGLV